MYIMNTILSIVLAMTGASQTIPSLPQGSKTDDVQIRINGPVHISATDTAAAVWVVNHTATIDGVVREGLGVVNGTARISGRVEGSVVTRQVGEIGLVADFAAEDRAVDHVGIVDDRINDRNLLLVPGVAEVVDRARVEEAAIADAGQIKL